MRRGRSRDPASLLGCDAVLVDNFITTVGNRLEFVKGLGSGVLPSATS